MKITWKHIRNFEEKPEKLYNERNMFVAKILYETISTHWTMQHTPFEKLSKFARSQWAVKALIIRHQIHDESDFTLG